MKEEENKLLQDPLKKDAWFNGSWTPLDKVNVNIQTHALQYGTGCIGGIRAYYNREKKNLFLFRLKEHFERLQHSGKILHMKFPFSVEEASNLSIELLKRGNWKQNVYLRPFLYKKDLDISPRLHNLSDGFALYAIPLDDYLDTTQGITAMVSSWRRYHDSQIPTHAKATGGYINSALAKSEAFHLGFDEAIFLDQNGNVAEGSAANLFIVHEKKLITPNLSSSILKGITRRTVMELASDLKIPVEERRLSKSELYTADEAFFTGTGVQIAWLKSIDKRTIGSGKIGEITTLIKNQFFNLVQGEDPKYLKWLTPVY